MVEGGIRRGVSIVGVPLDLGAGRRGVAMGPAALRLAEIKERVRELGYEVRDLGDVAVREPGQPGNPRLKYLAEIRSTCERLRDLVRGAAGEGRLPIVLGGDHSLAMGSIAGMSAHFRELGAKLGLIWFDAHADANTAETSPSGNIHGMPLAVALGLGEPSCWRSAAGRRWSRARTPLSWGFVTSTSPSGPT